MKKYLFFNLFSFIFIFNSIAGYIPGLVVYAHNNFTGNYDFIGKYYTNNPSVLKLKVCPNYSSYVIKAGVDGAKAMDPIWNTGATTDSIIVSEPGTYSCNYSYSSGGSFKLNVLVDFSTLSIEMDQTMTLPLCNSGAEINASINGGVSPYTFSWTPQASLSDPKILNPIVSGLLSSQEYILTVSDSCCSVNSKISITPSLIEPFTASLCMVTVDTIQYKNKLIWTKNPNIGIEKFRIYKQSNISSQYEFIHEQLYIDEAEFLDTLSRPNQEISRYKISIVDSCEHESALSSNHTTIMLSSSLGTNNTVNLFWNAYEGFAYNNFEIWRSFDGKNYHLLSYVANNTFAYIDNNPPSIGYYKVKVTNPNGCGIAKSGSPISLSSNVVDREGKGYSGIESSNDISNLIKVFPNPIQDQLNIISDLNLSGSPFSLSDMQGRILMTGIISEKQTVIDVSQIKKGVYFFNVMETSNFLKIVKL